MIGKPHSAASSRAGRRGLALLCAWSILLGCDGGGGTDVGNALVMGTVTDGGAAVAGAEVILMPAGYNPVLGDGGNVHVTVTGPDGGFRFEAVEPGSIAIEVLHPQGGRMDWSGPASVAAGETLMVASRLAAARVLAVRLPEGAAPDAYVFLPGTDVHARREGAGETLRLPHVPAESLRMAGVGSMSAPAEVTLYRIESGPADTALDLRGAATLP